MLTKDVDKDEEKLEFSSTAGGNVNGTMTSENSLRVPYNVKQADSSPIQS